jgi:hypothetical protein
MSADFVNLTNGLQCCPLAEPHFLRIQSTWCEQKRFADVLWTVGPDFLYHLATETSLTVHDVSEKRRVTRAIWQGIPWIRYVCQRTWGLDEAPAIGRNGQSMTHHFRRVYAELPQRVVKHTAYFGKFSRGSVAEVNACDFGRRATYRGAA